MSNAEQRSEAPDTPVDHEQALDGSGCGAAQDTAGGEETPSVETLTARLAEADRRATSAEERALRLQAEMDNLRKRTEREVENAHKFGNEKLLGELLPVIDSMELGLGAAKAESADVASVSEGIELTLRMLRGAVTKFGVEVVDPAGLPFDPDTQQAISMQPGQGAASNTVLQVVQKGYRLNGRLVRPALVIVAQ